MGKIKRLFGGLNMNWKRLAAFAIISGVYTGIMAMLPWVRGTSFHDIAMSFEWWVLFGIMIITNSASAKEAAQKCFVFFLISQPLVYLVQVPFSPEGFRIFRFYPGWFVWTLLTVPMGYIGYQMKKERWWGLLILTPVLLFVGFHYESFLSTAISFFPHHILSAVFCIITLIIYPLCLFENRKLKRVGLMISVAIILLMSMLAMADQKEFYSTSLMASGSDGIEFDDSCRVYLADEEYGSVRIEYDEKLDTYMMNADLARDGETELVIESPDGTKTVFKLIVENSSYDLIAQ